MTPKQQIAHQIGVALIGYSGRAATDLIAAAEANSPILDKRVQNALREAGNNAHVVAGLLSEYYGEDEQKSHVVRLRLTPSEREQLQTMSDDSGQTLSAFIRKRCGLQ